MRQHVTVISADRIISVDGHAIRVEHHYPVALHALQWHEGGGHQEWLDGPNTPLAPEDYETVVEPYVRLWETETARLDAEAHRPPTLEEAQLAKREEITTAYNAALIATLTMPAETPDNLEITLAALDFARDDPDGLADVRGILAARRAELLEAVEAAETVEEVQAVTVGYPV